jgi:hypothetical protein
MSASEARDVTTRIRNGCNDLCLLVLRAHDERAWAALGYRSWNRYVRAEFELSRSRSYELLDQGLVRRALQVATDSTDVPSVSARRAAFIKPVLAEVTDMIQLRLRAKGKNSPNTIYDVVREALETVRSKPALNVERETRQTAKVSGKVAGTREPTTPRGHSYDLETLSQAITYFAEMPPAGELIAPLSDQALRQLHSLPLAAERLTDLISHWSARAKGDEHNAAVKSLGNAGTRTGTGQLESSKAQWSGMPDSFVSHESAAQSRSVQ